METWKKVETFFFNGLGSKCYIMRKPAVFEQHV